MCIPLSEILDPEAPWKALAYLEKDGWSTDQERAVAAWIKDNDTGYPGEVKWSAWSGVTS
jgi:hypothetical protein